MINILIPMAGGTSFFDDANYYFPKPIIEVAGIPMIERVVENLSTIKEQKRFIFVVREIDCIKFHLDKALRLLPEEEIVVIKTERDTKGAACSSLLAMDYINNNEPLIISNGDQIIDINFNSVLNKFYKNHIDAGCIHFDSIHPRWSYISIKKTQIVEAAEKEPISKNAIAGFYFFNQGSHFVEAAKKMIVNDAHVNGQFFIAPVFNELILMGKKLTSEKISTSQYHTFYSPQKIEEYEKFYSPK